MEFSPPSKKESNTHKCLSYYIYSTAFFSVLMFFASIVQFIGTKQKDPNNTAIIYLQVYSIIAHPLYFSLVFMVYYHFRKDIRQAGIKWLSAVLVAVINLTLEYAWSIIPGKGMGYAIEIPRTLFYLGACICCAILMSQSKAVTTHQNHTIDDVKSHNEEEVV